MTAIEFENVGKQYRLGLGIMIFNKVQNSLMV